MTSATTKNETQETYGMHLPEGMTCADCARFRFCDVFLGGNIAGNTECDWAPSRFIQGSGSSSGSMARNTSNT
jgi:hypothetical protein